MNTPTASLCADRETLDGATAHFHFNDKTPSGHIASVRFEGLTIMSFDDADVLALADALERLARDLRSEAAGAGWPKPVKLSPDEDGHSLRADQFDNEQESAA